MAAADVGHLRAALEARLHALQCRDPLGDQVRGVAGAEEALGAAEQRRVVLVPADAQAGAQRAGHPRDRLELVDRDLEGAQDVEGAVLAGQRLALLLVEREAAGGRVVVDVAAGGLGRQPLQQVARIGLGAPGERLGVRRPLRERTVEAELVADHHGRRVHHGADVGHEAAHEGIELVGIERHGGPPEWRRAGDRRARASLKVAEAAPKATRRAPAVSRAPSSEGGVAPHPEPAGPARRGASSDEDAFPGSEDAVPRRARRRLAAPSRLLSPSCAAPRRRR